MTTHEFHLADITVTFNQGQNYPWTAGIHQYSELWKLIHPFILNNNPAIGVTIEEWVETQRNTHEAIRKFLDSIYYTPNLMDTIPPRDKHLIAEHFTEHALNII